MIYIKSPNKYAKYLIFALLLSGIVLVIMGYINNSESEINETEKLTEEEKYSKQLKDILTEIAGIGKMKIMVTTETTGGNIKVQGVAIICEGGDDPRVVKDIIGIVVAVYGIPSNKIYVAHMKN